MGSRDNRDSRQIDEEPKLDRPAPPSDDSRENNRQKEAPEKSDRPAAPAAKSNPFGNAKPVDRSERPERSADDSRENRDSRDNRDSRENNRRIDEEPKSDRPPPPAKSDRPPPPAAKSNPFGNAKPIDSTKREREMEEKLRKTEIVDDKSRSKTPTNQKPQHTNEKTTTNSDEKSGGDGPKKVRSPTPPKEIEEPPKVAVSNKYAFLPEDDEVGSGKDDSD